MTTKFALVITGALAAGLFAGTAGSANAADLNKFGGSFRSEINDLADKYVDRYMKGEKLTKNGSVNNIAKGTLGNTKKGTLSKKVSNLTSGNATTSTTTSTTSKKKTLSGRTRLRNLISKYTNRF